MELTSFKAYDVRGKVPSILNADMVRHIGFAYAAEVRPRRVVIGHDARLSGPALYAALADGLTAAGVDVTGIGLCGTEEIYHATFAHGFGGGIMVTGSHNPADENGLKMVRAGAVPISGDSGLFAIRARIAAGQSLPSTRVGHFAEASFRESYIRHLLALTPVDRLKSFRIVADAGNGCAGPVLRALAPYLPFELIVLHGEPDGTFPHGVPNPLLPDKREATARAVREHGADFGLAWDGDFDRCFFYDASGRFLEGYYLVGMIAAALLARHPGATIIHDPRLVWNTVEVVREAGGIPVESKTGHAFMKERMRREDALYGGEMSAHHYFRDFAYCDSGMLPWLMVTAYLSATGKTLAQCLDDRIRKFPCSGEINSTVPDPEAARLRVERHYADTVRSVSRIDGLSIHFADWRFNLRASNTEPVLRLNVETRGRDDLLQEKTAELLRLIRQEDAAQDNAATRGRPAA